MTAEKTAGPSHIRTIVLKNGIASAFLSRATMYNPRIESYLSTHECKLVSILF